MNLSVIINTINRPNSIEKCLEGLSYQSDKNFEVVVVDQSQNEETKALCNKYNLKYFRSNQKNISVSRNIGVANASSEIIAFIDDDAIPQKDWVKTIKKDFEKKDIDLLAGQVINKSNPQSAFVQFQNGIISCYGYAEDVRDLDLKDYQHVKDNWHLFALGANCAFKKSSIMKVGGFDEYYEYIHDESDLASRIMYDGGRAFYDHNLIVDHYPAYSHNRTAQSEVNWRVLTKNYFYFGMKNGRDIFLIRFIKSLKRIFGVQGPLMRIIDLYREKKIILKDLIKYKTAFEIGFLQGLVGGVFFKRKLNLVFSKSQFLLFKKN